MITVNMHEAKTRLSELVKAVEERNEVVVLCRDGREIAEIRRRARRRQVALKVAARKLQLREPPLQWFLGLSERYELRELPLDAHVACAAVDLPLIHRDPFDRVLVALAQAHALTVLTSDENIGKYPGVKTLW